MTSGWMSYFCAQFLNKIKFRCPIRDRPRVNKLGLIGIQLGIILMDNNNNQALFSPSPSRPGKLRDEAEEPGVSERGTRSGPALWNSSPPRRYDGGQPEQPLLCLRTGTIPRGIMEFACACRGLKAKR